MKLSEAIREGAKLRPQGFGGFVTLDSNNVTCTCVIAAAFEALTGKLPDINRDRIIETVAQKTGVPYRVEIVHPVFNYQTNPYHAAYALNDNERWTREQIAAWLEGQGY